MVGCTVNQVLGSYLSTILAFGGNGIITLNVSSSVKELVVGNGIDLFPCLCYDEDFIFSWCSHDTGFDRWQGMSCGGCASSVKRILESQVFQ